jgi:hypothetical protein
VPVANAGLGIDPKAFASNELQRELSGGSEENRGSRPQKGVAKIGEKAPDLASRMDHMEFFHPVAEGAWVEAENPFESGANDLATGIIASA